VHRNNRVQRLTGEWRLATDPGNRGRDAQWFGRPLRDAHPAPVPGVIQQVFPEHHGLAWYWHTFVPRVDAGPSDRILLHVGAADYLAEVWLNGVPVGGHEGPQIAFDLDVTAAIRHGVENLLAIRILNPADEPIDGIRLLETPHGNKTCDGNQSGAAYNFGGITAPVELRAVPAVRIADVFAKPDVTTGGIGVTVTVRNDTPSPADGCVVATACTAPEETFLDRAEVSGLCPPGESTHRLDLTLAQPRLWSPDDPSLYRVGVALSLGPASGTAPVHACAVRCGFRDFRVVNGYFRLNGKRVFLRSTHTGNHFPIGQEVPPTPDLMFRDLLYAKASGFNCVRFICGLPFPEQLDFCDAIGLMIYEETRASWCLADSPQMADRFDRSIREMVLRDRNHPSVTIWGLLNETTRGATCSAVLHAAPRPCSSTRRCSDTVTTRCSGFRSPPRAGSGRSGIGCTTRSAWPRFTPCSTGWTGRASWTGTTTAGFSPTPCWTRP
jgi:beta-galactosidase/beta-glucuronidase